MNSAIVVATTSVGPLTSATTRRDSALVSPPTSKPSPNCTSVASTVSTSKCSATLEQPVAASQRKRGSLVVRSWSGLNVVSPQSAMWGKSSSVQECTPHERDP